MRKRIVKSFVLLPAVLVCLHLAAAVPHAQEAYKIDEVKNPRCDLSEVPQIDPPPWGQFAGALKDNPEFRGAIVIYGLEGYARTYAEQVRDRFNNFAGVAAERLVTIYGGHTEDLRMELWVIPTGAAEPKTNYVEDTKSARQFAVYAYWGEVCDGGRDSALVVFAEALKLRPDWRGHIVARPHRNHRRLKPGDEGWDPDGYVSRKQALRRAVKDKRSLVKKFGIAPVRVKAVLGGNDTWTHAELWLIPPGVEPPATEAARSKK